MPVADKNIVEHKQATGVGDVQNYSMVRRLQIPPVGRISASAIRQTPLSDGAPLMPTYAIAAWILAVLTRVLRM